jgi:hypothetical protein
MQPLIILQAAIALGMLASSIFITAIFLGIPGITSLFIFFLRKRLERKGITDFNARIKVITTLTCNRQDLI